MTTELLPCPFCDHKLLMPHVHSRRAKTSGGYHHFVRCPRCHTEGPRSLGSTDDAIIAWNRRTAASAEQTDVPTGWKMVPVSPTLEILEAGARSIIDGQDGRPGTSWADESGMAYAAMLAAAPQPPQQPSAAPESEQKPYAWATSKGLYRRRDEIPAAELPPFYTPVALYAVLYTAAPATLSDEQILAIQTQHIPKHGWSTNGIAFARALLAAAGNSQSQAARDVLAERARQVNVEGWTTAHDDQYQNDELSLAAACYAIASDTAPQVGTPQMWPWPDEWWKPTTERRNLVKAGALILAEIERLDRATMPKQEGGEGA